MVTRRALLLNSAASGLALLVGACPRSPEDGRPRGGGHGADGGNYRAKPIHVPSKLDGTREPGGGGDSR